jgi:hypothetical protein
MGQHNTWKKLKKKNIKTFIVKHVHAKFLPPASTRT